MGRRCKKVHTAVERCAELRRQFHAHESCAVVTLDHNDRAATPMRCRLKGNQPARVIGQQGDVFTNSSTNFEGRTRTRLFSLKIFFQAEPGEARELSAGQACAIFASLCYRHVSGKRCGIKWAGGRTPNDGRWDARKCRAYESTCPHVRRSVWIGGVQIVCGM